MASLHPSSKMLGHIVSPGELLSIGDEEEPEGMPKPRMYSSSHPSLPEHITPLLPPPPFEGSTTRKPSDRSLLNEMEKSVASASYPTSDVEDSTVFTARRVRVQELDVLDIPAPAPFSSASTIGRPLPPGLVPLSSRHAWRDSLSVITGSSNGAGIAIDVLDAEPPRAGDGWKSLAGGFLGVSAGSADPSQQRTTFGTVSLDIAVENPGLIFLLIQLQVIHQGNPLASERGSLHSMRSHLSPYSARSSSGSAPASFARVFNLSGSNSSRPSANSAYSRVATTSSASLNPSRPFGTISPSVRAFGHADPLRYMSHATEEYEDLFAEPGSRTSILGPMSSFSARSALSQPTIRGVGGCVRPLCLCVFRLCIHAQGESLHI